MRLRYWAPIIATAGLAVHVLAAPKPPPLVVKKRAVRPTLVGGSGGDVWLNLAVSKRRARVLEVRAQAQIVGGRAGRMVTLARLGGVFQGNCPVPRNPQTRRGQASIVIFATTTDGAEPERKIATVRLLPGDDAYPPAPPD